MPRLELPDRVDERPLPPVEVVDMRERRSRGPLHPRTVEALAEVRGDGGKAIVLINRRGWSVHLACRSCGRAWECPELRRVAGAAPLRQPQLPPLRPRRAGAGVAAPTAAR